MLNRYIKTIKRVRSVSYLTGVFIFAHIIYYLAGVRFDSSPLDWFWQYLDTELLRNRLLESIFYLHSQPPLFNFFLGAVLKVSKSYGDFAFQIIYVTAGLALYLSLFWLQVKLGVSRGVAFATSTLFMLSPSFILYEHWLFYTFPVAALFVLSALLFYEVVTSKRAWAAVAFFATLFLICGIRHIFHLAYYLFIAAALTALCAGFRKKVLLSAAVPFAILFSFYAKNYFLFGQFSASSWSGMYLWEVTGNNITLERREFLVERGKTSDVSLVKAFSPLEEYPKTYTGVVGFKGIPALREIKKSNGYTNYNNVAYIKIADNYLRDSIYICLHEPRGYIVGISKSWFGYFRSSSDLCFFTDSGNLQRISLINNFYNYVFYGKIPFDVTKIPRLHNYSNRPQYFYLFLLFGLPSLILFAFMLARPGSNEGNKGLNRVQSFTILYICGTVIYVAIMAGMLGAKENNRCRFMTEPLYVVLFGLFSHYSLKPLLKKLLRSGRSLKAGVINRVSKGTLGTPL